MKLLLTALLLLTSIKAADTFIAVGNPAPFTDSLGQVWAAETGCSGGTVFTTGTAIAGTIDDTLYQYGRVGSNISCTANVGIGIYSIRLKFADVGGYQLGQQIFNIYINGTTQRSNFDIIGITRTQNTAYDVVFPLFANLTPSVTIMVSQVSGSAQLQAFSIIAAASGGSSTLPTPSASLQYLRTQPGSSSTLQFATLPLNFSIDYDFTQQSPPENLSPTLKTITLTPVPLGVNGTDVNHFLGIYNNAGVWQESGLIVGGTAASGASSGTIIFSSLSGTYATSTYHIGSPTAGIREAVLATPLYSRISTPDTAAGTLLYSTLTIDRGNTLIGPGAYGPLRCQFANANCVEFTNAAGIQGYVGIQDLMIYSDVAAGTSGDMLLIQDKVQGFVNNVSLPFNSYIGIHTLQANTATQSQVRFSGNRIGTATKVGWLENSCGGEHINDVIVAANAADEALYIWSPVICTTSGTNWIGGVIYGGQYTIALNKTLGSKTVNEVVMSDVIIDGCQVTCIYLLGSAAGGESGSVGIYRNLHMSSLGSCLIIGTNWNRISLESSYCASISDGVILQGSQNVIISSNHFVGSGPHTFQITDSNSNGSGTPNAAVKISNNLSGFDATTGAPTGSIASLGIWIRSTATHTNLDISNNHLNATTIYTNESATTFPTGLDTNVGIKNTQGSVASATTVALINIPNPVVSITGSTAVTTITGHATGEKVTFIKTDAGSIAFNTGGAAPNDILAAKTLAQFGSLLCTKLTTSWICQ